MTNGLPLDLPPAISATGIPRHGEASNTDSYLLPEHWCFHIYGYHAKLELDGDVGTIQPGDASLVPPGVRMVYRYFGPSEHVYFHFKTDLGGRALALPMTLSLGSHYDSMDRRARDAVKRARTDPSYSVAVLWTLLWEYADLSTGKSEASLSTHNPLISMAVQHIEQCLALPFSVATLSQEIGVSNGYLTRLFHRELGLSVSNYIRRRRAEQALHLLTSTNMPIKAIARSIGVPQLTQFNRLLKNAYGEGPRAIRSMRRDSGTVSQAVQD